MFFQSKLDNWQKHWIVFASLFFIVVLFLVPEKCHHGDMSCWANWAKYIRIHGLTHIYETDTDYLPAYHYLLLFYGYSLEVFDNFFSQEQYFKILIFLFHLGSTFIFIQIIRREIGVERVKYGLLYLLNAAVLYNTLIWGQVDELISFFMILCLYFIMKSKIRFGIMAFILAVNFKLQAIIFLPILLFVSIPHYYKEKWKVIFIDLLSFSLLQTLIFLPFILAGKINKVLALLLHLVDSQPYISANAYNLWFALIGRDARYRIDTDIFLIYNYKTWGLALFFLGSFIALLPLFINCMKGVLRRGSFEINKNILILSLGIIPLIFFFFCTQMHERYSHPAVIFVVLYSVFTRKWHLGFLASLAYLLNLDAVLRSLPFQNYGVLLFDSRCIAVLFFAVIVLLYREIYLEFLSKRKL